MRQGFISPKMTTLKTALTYLNSRPMLTGVFTVLVTVALGMSIAFATGLTTPAQVMAQVVGPPCCVPPPPPPPPPLPPPPPPPPVVPPVPSCDLDLSASTIPAAGGDVTVSWTTAAASHLILQSNDANDRSATLTDGWEDAHTHGSVTVPVSIATEFTMTVNGVGGKSTCSAKVAVEPPPAEVPTCTLVAAPTSIEKGAESELSWTTTNATVFKIDHKVGKVDTVDQGKVKVSPTETTTYTGKAKGPGGEVECTTTVTVTDTPPPPPDAPTCTLTADPLEWTHGHINIFWTTKNADTFSIDHAIGIVTPTEAGSTAVSPKETTTYTGTATGHGKTVRCSVVITVGTPPPTPDAPTCTLADSSANDVLDYTGDGKLTQEDSLYLLQVAVGSKSCPAGKTCDLNGDNEVRGGDDPFASDALMYLKYFGNIGLSGTHTLVWSTTHGRSFVLDNGIADMIPVPAGSTKVSPTVTTTYTGTVTGPGGTAKCSVTITVPPVTGCTSHCGGGGGGGNNPPNILLTSTPHTGEVAGAYIYLSQIPYTGLDLGPTGTIIYWIGLIVWSLALAYLVLFGAMPVAARSARTFGERVSDALNKHAVTPAPVMLSQAPEPADEEPAEPVAEETHEAGRGYSAFDGFKSFAQHEVLSIEDIVKGLARSHKIPSAPERVVEPVHEHVEPMLPAMSMSRAEVEREETPTLVADVRGLTTALVQGDRAGVFAGLRQHTRDGGSAEALISSIVFLLDDAYRARIDGSACDPDIMRVTARLNTSTLEKLVAALTTAIDSSYSMDVTAAKLALTRALSVLGA